MHALVVRVSLSDAESARKTLTEQSCAGGFAVAGICCRLLDLV